MSTDPVAHLPERQLLRPDEAAAWLGISRDTFDERVLPRLRVVHLGRLRLIPVAELEGWIDREARRDEA